MRKIKLKKKIGDYKAGTVFTVLDENCVLDRCGIAWGPNGYQISGHVVDAQRAEAWSHVGLLVSKKGGKR
jgi:hypothetical protein